LGDEAWGKGKEGWNAEAGRRADVLILNRNPLDDMHATMDIFRIVQVGMSLTAKARQAAGSCSAARPCGGRFCESRAQVPFIDEIWPELISTKDACARHDQGKQLLQE
jgi:hypothetical protein